MSKIHDNSLGIITGRRSVGDISPITIILIQNMYKDLEIFMLTDI